MLVDTMAAQYARLSGNYLATFFSSTITLSGRGPAANAPPKPAGLGAKRHMNEQAARQVLSATVDAKGAGRGFAVGGVFGEALACPEKAHQRLHRHAGVTAVQCGQPSHLRAQYGAMFGRGYGYLCVPNTKGGCRPLGG
jgi:hypothetical protein